MGNFFSRKCDVPRCYHHKRKTYCGYHRNCPPCQFHECGCNTVNGSLYCDSHTCRFANCFERVKEQLIFDIGEYKSYLYCFEHNCQSEECTNFKESNRKYCYKCLYKNSFELAYTCCDKPIATCCDTPITTCCDTPIATCCDTPITSCCKYNQSNMYCNTSLSENTSESFQPETESNINLVITEVDIIKPSSTGCIDCKKCKKCKSCVKCINCTNLDSCKECINTHNSINCTNLDSCKECINTHNAINSTKCNNSSNLQNCSDCTNTHRSINCVNCKNCQDCINCYDCEDCPPTGL